MQEGVEIVRHSASEGGLSIWTKEKDETLPSFEEDTGIDEGQEATLVEEERTSPKTMFGSIYKSLKRKKVKRTSIILPPQVSAQLNLELEDERRQEANQKADYARRLLEAAFRPSDAHHKQDPAEFKGMKRIDMIETAFKYAVEARRLTGTTPQEEDALDDHRAQGEAAALEAHHFILAYNSKALLPNINVEEQEDDGSINGGLYTPQDIQDAADKHRKRAYFHMEHILSTFDKKIKAPQHIILNRSPERNGEDVTLSTLGFDNTFQESPTNSKEKYSITSLNELMDGPQSQESKRQNQIIRPPAVHVAAEKELNEPLQVSPLSGTVESQPKLEVEQVVNQRPDEQLMRETAPPPQTTEKSAPKSRMIKPGSLLPLRMKRNKKSKTNMDDAASGGAEDVSVMSELESIRKLEENIQYKLKNAAAHDDGEFSLVGDDEAKMEAPKFVKAPSLDLSIMSLENWDKVADGNSLEDIVQKAEAEKEQRFRQEQGIPLDDDDVPAELKPTEQAPKQPILWSRLWRSRSENFAQVKQAPAPAPIERGPSALDAQKVKLVGGKKPDVIPPPFVIVSAEDRVQSTLDDAAPKYQVESMNILGLDAAPANEDALSKGTKGKKWKKMMSWKQQEATTKNVISSAKRLSIRKKKDANSEAGVYHPPAKDVTTTTDTDACSWEMNRLNIKSLETKEEFVGDKYRTLAEDVDSAIENAERNNTSSDPLDSGIDMLLNNANPDIVRQVLSADAAKVHEDSGNPVDFADVEYENEDEVRKQTALMSRNAVLENIYAERQTEKTAKPLERSATHANEDEIRRSPSFLKMIEEEKKKLENPPPVKPKRIRSFFHRSKGKHSAVPAS